MVAAATAPGGGRQNHPLCSKSDLSHNGIKLVELMQNINFGRIENLLIEECQPVLNAQARVIREYKFPGENGPRPESHCDDFALKTQVIELFRTFDELRNCTIEVLEVKHGLPFRMAVEGAA